MGINLNHIKGIFHYSLPESLESYIQQIGRSGRLKRDSYCRTFVSKKDFLFNRNKNISVLLFDRDQRGRLLKQIIKSNEKWQGVNVRNLEKKFGLNKEGLFFILANILMLLPNLQIYMFLLSKF